MECLINFGLGIFLFAIATIDGVNGYLKMINEKAKIGKERAKTLKLLSNFVEYHLALMQLSDRDQESFFPKLYLNFLSILFFIL